MAKKWVRLPRIAAHCDLSSHAVYKLVQAGIMPHGRAGRILVFDIEEVDAWLKQRGSAGQVSILISEEDQKAEVASRIADEIQAEV
jgi:predicted DNA-binding transcriptional regulator AlpA